MSTRIYAVKTKGENKQRLVEATSSAQAIKHVAAEQFSVEVATTKVVAELMAAGAKLEKASVN